MSCVINPSLAAKCSQQLPNQKQVMPPANMEAGFVSRRLIPVTRWNDSHQYPPLGQLRALIFNAETNGFNYCVRRIGRRVLIDEAAYFTWVDNSASNTFVTEVSNER